MTTGMAGVYMIIGFVVAVVVIVGFRWLAGWMTYVNNRD